MKQLHWIFAFLLWLACVSGTLAQTDQSGGRVLVAGTTMTLLQQHAEDGATLSAQREKRAQIFLMSVKEKIVSAADAMPADKYGFTPVDGEFKGARTFGQQVNQSRCRIP
jgi:cytochrome b561